MEALSGAASGIAVVSLTIQLIQSVVLVREFIKDVKGASKELYRLVGKLELLNALLEDAKKVLEQQSSLSGMHFPTPSMAIFKCLQGCEKSIQPLVDIVKRLSLPQSRFSSSTARLKSEIKLALKTKELTTLETRIQHDIDLLTTGLSVNQNSILMNIFPILLRNQETMLKSNKSPPVASIICSNLEPTVKTLDTVSSFASPRVRYSQQTILVRSTFKRLGLYRRKAMCYQDQKIEDSEGNVKSYKRDILWTANEVSAMWKFLGFGMTFTQQHPYGSIFPSLRTYPVGYMNVELRQAFKHGSVQELQEKFSSGALHPFYQTPIGYSLLHLAAFYNRSDLCRLIIGYGVKPELTSDSRSPLTVAMMLLSSSHIASNIDTYRCFLDDVDLFDELNKMGSHEFGPLRLLSADDAQWLWQKSSELVAGDDNRSNQRIMIRSFWTNVAFTYFADIDKVQFPFVSMDRDILSDIQYGRCQILRDVIRFCESSMDSYIVGARFLDWLISLDLDPELCVASEHAELRHANLEHPDLRYLYAGEKRIVFERNWEQKWILGFEWVFDHKAPGYILVSEFTTIVVEPYWGSGWPYFEYDWESRNKRNEDVRSALFSRRMAAKERKGRARLGQKQPRSRMPGAWKW